MAAEISSSIAAKPTIISASREDLDSGDIVTLEANDLTHLTYSWSLVFTPTSLAGVASAASLSSTTGPGPITFTVDNEGSYLVKLIVDSGLFTESTQYVRLRRLTDYSGLRLAAAGETKTLTESVPVDINADGWSLDQNFNLLNLENEVSSNRDILSTADAFGKYLSLDRAYDGFDSLDPAVITPGSGRVIVADSGDVVIQSSIAPSAITDLDNPDGRLLVENGIYVGSPSATEIDIIPNESSAGPSIIGGNSVDIDVPSSGRSIPAFTIMAGYGATSKYDLNLFTKSMDSTSAIGDSGGINIKTGDIESASNPSNINIQTGKLPGMAGSGGNIVLAPCTGKIHVSDFSSSTPCSLMAANPFVGGSSGDLVFYISGYGEYTVSILNTDNILDVQNKLNAIPFFSCLADPLNDPITITCSEIGPIIQVYFILDKSDAATNTAVGDFTILGGAGFSQGSYGNGTTLYSLPSYLRIEGDASVGANDGHGHLYSCVDMQYVDFAASPYSVGYKDQFIETDTTAGPVLLDLPDPSLVPRGTKLIIKDSVGNSSINNIAVTPAAGSIDGMASFVINSNWTSITLVSNGTTTWYLV